MDYINWYNNAELALHTWDKSHLSMEYSSFYTVLDSICYSFVEDVYIYVCERYWFIILFSCNVFLWFWNLGNKKMASVWGKKKMAS